MVKRHIIKKVVYKKSHRLSPLPNTSLNNATNNGNKVKGNEKVGNNKNKTINKETKTVQEAMITTEKIDKMQEILQQAEAEPKTVKRIKKEKGLIERAENEKIVLTEDNKMLLND